MLQKTGIAQSIVTALAVSLVGCFTALPPERRDTSDSDVLSRFPSGVDLLDDSASLRDGSPGNNGGIDSVDQALGEDSVVGNAGDTVGNGCVPPQTQACYESPSGQLLGVVPARFQGNCRLGSRTCGSDGTFGPCMGAVAPQLSDTCQPGDDATCNGKSNEGCSCINGQKRECGTDTGECVKGMQTCQNSSWGECIGEVKPAAADTCDADNDANCNGSPNEGCACVNGTLRDCGSATGNCKRGQQTCKNGVWSTCMGGITAQAADRCSPVGDDANCNGVPNEGCDCIPGQTRPCSKCGTQTCDGNGKWATTCSGQKDCDPSDIMTDTQSCGNCGQQGRKAVCSAQCTWGAWQNVGACLGSGPCSPGVTADLTQNVSCGNCGLGTLKQIKRCTAQCDWPVTWTNSGSCVNDTGCTPGSTIAATSVTCSYCGTQPRERVCNAQCTYNPPSNKGSCILETADCPGMPGDERVGYVVCPWPDTTTQVCASNATCCLQLTGEYQCLSTSCPGYTLQCDGPEDCSPGKKCCSQFAPDGSENSYSTCESDCLSLVKCHADQDCPSGWHCSKATTGDYHNGVCYLKGNP